MHLYSTISAGFSNAFLRGAVCIFHSEVLVMAEGCKVHHASRKKMANTVFSLNHDPLWVSHFDSLPSYVTGCRWCVNAFQCT